MTINFLWLSIIGANLRQLDQADAIPVGCKNMHAVVAVTDPSRACPYVTVYICPNAVGKAGFALVFHRCKFLAILQTFAVDHIPYLNVLGSVRVVGCAGVCYILGLLNDFKFTCQCWWLCEGLINDTVVLCKINHFIEFYPVGSAVNLKTKFHICKSDRGFTINR